MYIAEWMAWCSNLKPDEWYRKYAEEQGSSPPFDVLYEDDVEEDRRRQSEKRFPHAKTRGPIYACNDTYLEMRCGGMEDKRGFITLTTLVLFYFVLGSWIDIEGRTFWAGLSGAGTVFGRALTTGDLLAATVVSPIAGGILWLYFKYAFRFSRLEMLTSRHLLIRFNRVTRQVYLHRPPSCGGILVLPWDGIGSLEVAGQRLLLGWLPDKSFPPFPVLTFVGKQSSSQADLQAEWEFIRRYMDEGGLAAVPKPRISSQLPLPWSAFTAQFEGLGPFQRNAGPLVWLGCLLISPAFLIMGLSHWASLLLCWRPRWPKVIREAGQPGKPVPAFTTVADYPPDVQAQLLANAHHWELRPGRAPEKLRRGRKR